ncbi:zinc finger and SCAN domain-containing protein 31-like isoform X3 [Tiliqua scincoides]|uniref:zinc finger and SCAN domain-containing protein 31-like isoform X3 n=1 Tax=Tiliqua scincoides TaxID=71010 RepID=UPI003461B6C0
MNGQTSGGPEEGTGEVSIRDQPESLRKPQQGQEEPGRGMQQGWDSQWQQFLQTLQASHPAQESPQQSEATPWDDAKAFLASFEQVAAACRWPRGEWVARLLPALSGEAQQAFSLLAGRDKGDYGKVKAAVLRGEALRREKQRQYFRQFCCLELEDPRRMYSQVQELCCQWLKPERHTKEQILELLVLEQFLASLPADIQSWVRAGGPDNCAQAVALLEDFLMSRREAEAGMWQAMNPRKMDVSFHVVEQTPMQSSQQTTFWKVLQEDGENVDSLIDLAPHPVKKEETFVPDPVQSPRFPGQDSDKDLQEPRKSFSQRSNLLRYQRVSTGKKPHQCPECGKSFSWRSSFLRHQNIHTGEKPHVCPDCGKSFSQRSHMLNHQNIHTREKSHNCPKCGKSFSWRSSLLTHLVSHTEKKPHKCPDCGKKFTWRSNFLRHQNVHTREKSYMCPDCGKSFARRSHLLRHQNIHTGEKPHTCPDCGKSFSRRSSLLTHQVIHTGKKPHQSPDCGKEFSQRSALVRHQRIHTAIKPTGVLCVGQV